MRLTDAQIDDLKARADLAALATQFGATLRKSGRNMIGSCPLCGGGKRATRFEIKDNGAVWLCAVCSEGGDALALVQKARGCDFRAAVEFLGGTVDLSPAEERRLAGERLARERKRAAEAEKFRAASIASAWRLWHGAEQFPLSAVETYLSARGIWLPRSAEIRAGRNCPYFHGETVDELGRKAPRVLLRSAAMLAAIRDAAGEFIGVHITYLAEDFRAKARIIDPDTGEALPAKKMRGAKTGGHIGLRTPDAPERLFMGEGIETTLSVACAFRNADKLRRGDAFWSAGDLGNLGGKAHDSVAHPSLKTPGGRAARVPGPDPDFDAPGIVIPASVRELALLGDGDSDPFTTQMAMERAKARYARPGLEIKIAMAPAGQDFNDVLLAGAAA